MIEFFMNMKPPTATHQMKQVRVVNGKPKFYEPRRVAEARALYRAHLAAHRPDAPLTGPVQLVTKWCYENRHKPTNDTNRYKPTKPDTDNMIKLLKDEMTRAGFWHDDAQVASEVTEKFWATPPGIYVWVKTLENEHEKG